MSDTFTKTEAMRRVRACKAAATRNPRAYTGWVGFRNMQEQSIMPTWAGEDTFYSVAFREGDDLCDWLSVEEAAINVQGCARYGSVIHLYLYDRGRPGEGDGDLWDVIVCWLGTPDEAPRIQIGSGSKEVTA